MRNYIGRIYENPLPGEFSFASTEYYDGDFVKLLWKSLCGVCRIIEKKAANRRFTDPFAVHFIDEDEKLDDGLTFTYTARLLRVLDENGIAPDGRFPLAPGLPVYEVEANLVSTAYGISDEGICVGRLSAMPGCKVYLRPEEIFHPHIAILGKTGSGKSYFAKGLMKALTDYTRIVFSPTDEYNDLDIRAADEDKTLISGEQIVFPYSVDWLARLWGLNYTEEKALSQVTFDKDLVYGAKEAVTAIEQWFQKNGLSLIEQAYLDETGAIITQVKELPSHVQSLIAKIKRHPVQFCGGNGATELFTVSRVVDMSGCAPWLQEYILAFYAERLLERQKRIPQEKRRKTILLLEEAHNYVPSVRNPLCKDPLVRLAREGRKYGISLCMITQRPRNFDQTALSQSGNKFLFSMSHPDDIRSVLEDAYYYSSDMTGRIQRLRVGECVINGDAVRDAFQLEVRFD